MTKPFTCPVCKEKVYPGQLMACGPWHAPEKPSTEQVPGRRRDAR